LKSESENILNDLKKLDSKVVFIFVSVAVITFLSIAIGSPSFYYDHFGRDKFDSRIYWFLADGIIMFFIPVILIKYVLKENLKDYGLTLGDKKFGIATSLLFLAVMMIVVLIVSGSKDFLAAYPQGGKRVSESAGNFVLYETSILIYMLGWEFFWRGFMLFGLKPKFGYYSVFIQMIPFFILHKGKPELELFASIFAGIILGLQALRSGSFIYCWILHWLVMIAIDSLSILRSVKPTSDIGILQNLFF
jgi:hypothetical protein